MMNNRIALIILTFNEEKQIERCILSAKNTVDEVYLIDSFSNDKTLEIAKKHGVKVYQNKWPNNHGIQSNWALDNIPSDSEWVMRIDADEYLSPELQNEIKENFKSIPQNINAVILKRRVIFFDRWIKWGGYYPHYSIRIWRRRAGRYDERFMDEMVKIENPCTITLKYDLIENNVNTLSWWIDKHNNYATREAVATLISRYSLRQNELSVEFNSSKDKRKRWLKENFYTYLPLFLRPFLYFIYRYIFRLGFLDGVPGLIWHFLQGFWYRFLVDAKIYDIERRAKKENKTMPEVIKEHYGIEV